MSYASITIAINILENEKRCGFDRRFQAANVLLLDPLKSKQKRTKKIRIYLETEVKKPTRVVIDRALTELYLLKGELECPLNTLL